MALSFPNKKTQCVHFGQLDKQHHDPVLHLYGSPIPVVELRNLNSLAFYLIENSVLYPILNISKLNVYKH